MFMDLNLLILTFQYTVEDFQKMPLALRLTFATLLCGLITTIGLHFVKSRKENTNEQHERQDKLDEVIEEIVKEVQTAKAAYVHSRVKEFLQARLLIRLKTNDEIHRCLKAYEKVESVWPLHSDEELFLPRDPRYLKGLLEENALPHTDEKSRVVLDNLKQCQPGLRTGIDFKQFFQAATQVSYEIDEDSGLEYILEGFVWREICETARPEQRMFIMHATYWSCADKGLHWMEKDFDEAEQTDFNSRWLELRQKTDEGAPK
jgi:hypothetical protein